MSQCLQKPESFAPQDVSKAVGWCFLRPLLSSPVPQESSPPQPGASDQDDESLCPFCPSINISSFFSCVLP